MTCAAHGLAHTRGYLLGEDVDLIRELAAKIMPARGAVVPVVADIGAGSGTTALSVFAELPPGKVRLYSFDTDDANLDWAALAIANIERTPDWIPVNVGGYDGSFTHRVHGTPIDPPAVNLVLVDGDHSYDGVLADFWFWAVRMLEPYLMWFHDYHVAAQEPGSRKAIDELIEQGHLTVIREAGFGIACTVNCRVPEE